MSKALSLGKLMARAMVCTAVMVTIGTSQAAAGDVPLKSSTQKEAAAATQLKPQTICPVMGNEINRSLFVDVNGKRIYVCCKACIDPVKKNPEKYIKKLEKLGQSVETIGAPATGASVDSKDTAAATAKCPVMNDTSGIKGCFTCPMHPDVMKKYIGKCQVCGMDLVFRTCPLDSAKTKGSGGCCRMKKK